MPRHTVDEQIRRRLAQFQGERAGLAARGALLPTAAAAGAVPQLASAGTLPRSGIEGFVGRAELQAAGLGQRLPAPPGVGVTETPQAAIQEPQELAIAEPPPAAPLSLAESGTVRLADVQGPNVRGTLSAVGVGDEEARARQQRFNQIMAAVDSIRRGNLERRAQRGGLVGQAAHAELARLEARDLQRQQSQAAIEQERVRGQFGLAQVHAQTAAQLKASREQLNPIEIEIGKIAVREQNERNKEKREQLGAARSILGETNRLQRILTDELPGGTGLFAPELAAGASLGAAVGFESGIPRAAAAEEFESIVNRIAGGLTKQLTGPLTEKELVFIRRQAPSLRNQTEANQQIIENIQLGALSALSRLGVDLDTVGIETPQFRRIKGLGLSLPDVIETAVDEGMTISQVLDAIEGQR